MLMVVDISQTPPTIQILQIRGVVVGIASMMTVPEFKRRSGEWQSEQLDFEGQIYCALGGCQQRTCLLVSTN